MAILLIIAGIACGFLGCSAAAPVSPSPGNKLTSGDASASVPQHVLWGMWHVVIDQNTGEAEVIPLRGPAFNANVQQFLSPPVSPTNKMIVAVLPTSNLAEGYVEADVTLVHPFPGLNEYSGFDVRGIFMADGTHASQYDPAIKYGDGTLNEAYVLNPDGYTRWWNATEFTDPMPLLSYKPGKLGSEKDPSATLNPYKYYADDLAYDGDVAKMTTANRGVFTPSGPTHKRLYKIQFPMIGGSPSLQFNYAIDASWDQPDPKYAPQYPASSFPASAQCQEAYNISVNTGGSNAWFNGGNSGGKVHLGVEVFDWQSMVNPSGVPGEIKAIHVESPVMASPMDIFPTSIRTAGSQPTSSVFSTDLTGSALNLTSAGTFPMLISVESVSPNSYQPQIAGGSSFVYPSGPLAAYTMGSVTISNQQGFVPAPDVTGNLKLSVLRNSSLSLSGIKLDWTANTNPSPFYAIYANDNPYDGVNPTIFVAEVTTETATVNATLWPAFSTNNSYVFAIKGRSVGGNPSSESPDLSQEAFVGMQDFDGGANSVPWTKGYGDPAYKWELYPNGHIDGSTCLHINPGMPVNEWTAMVGPPIPAIANSEMSYLEFDQLSDPNEWNLQFSGGFTHTTPPTGTSQYLDYDTTQDFYAIMDGTYNWIEPSGPPPGGGWTALVDRFGWNYPSSSFFGWRVYDMPRGSCRPHSNGISGFPV